MAYEECNVDDCMMAAGYVGVPFSVHIQCMYNSCVFCMYKCFV